MPDPDPTPDPTPKTDPAPDPKPDPKDPELGESGQRALAAEREARKAAEKAAKANEAELAKIREELDAHKAGQLSESEKAIAAARKEADKAARTEVTSQFQARIDRAAVQSAAAGKFADPADAVALLDTSTLARDADGDLTVEAVNAALDELLKAKPHLAGKNGNWGDPGSGPRGTATPAQLSRADLASMTPEEIVEAKAAGRLNGILGIT